MPSPLHCAPVETLHAFCIAVLKHAGADDQTAGDATRAMMHGSLHGVDSHGIRLLPHYALALQHERLDGQAKIEFHKTRAGSGMLEANHAHGARAMYAAADLACDLAKDAGIGAVGVRNSSHFGPAGAYSFAMAERGMVGIVFGNSDSFVRLHDGAMRFHGTNPLSVAAPAPDNPWLLDMATSSIPVNRVELYKSLGTDLPDGAGSDAGGVDTNDPHLLDMLAPVGGAFGFKGAALAGVAEIFSAVMTGMRISPDILSMSGPDMDTPRELGSFAIALDPDAFGGGAVFAAGIMHYLKSLRDSPARDGARVMAPGDREWEEATRRRRDGIPVDPATSEEFHKLAKATGLDVPMR